MSLDIYSHAYISHKMCRVSHIPKVFWNRRILLKKDVLSLGHLSAAVTSNVLKHPFELERDGDEVVCVLVRLGSSADEVF